VITRARYEEIALFSHIPCLEKCDALFCDAGIGYINAVDVRKLKQLLYEVSRGLYFMSLRSTVIPDLYKLCWLLKDLVYSIFLPKFICTVHPSGQSKSVQGNKR
jgi:hypothetical protein